MHVDIHNCSLDIRTSRNIVIAPRNSLATRLFIIVVVARGASLQRVWQA